MTCRTLSQLLALAALSTGICVAQYQSRPGRSPGVTSGRRVFLEDNRVEVNEDTVRTARETQSHSMDTPTWPRPPGFERDVFTFARIVFHSEPRSGGFGRGFGQTLGWWVDYPDADLNLSYRLQQLTSVLTDPDARVLRLTDPDLCDYPLLYMEHAGYMVLSDAEIHALQKYLGGGGAIFVNDFWSAQEWDGFAAEIARVVPGAWEDLDTDHPVFHCIFDLRRPMHELRVPTMQLWNAEFDARDPRSPPHRTFRGEGSETMHVRALPDKRGRFMILAIHNSDVSDGWEREAQDDTYFTRFSEKVAYPLGLNIIFYLMTH